LATATKRSRIEEALANISHQLGGLSTVSVQESAVIRQRLPAFVNRFRLSVRESETLSYLWQRMSRKEMARRMGISQETVKMHVNGLYEKLGLKRFKDPQNGLRDVLIRLRPPQRHSNRLSSPSTVGGGASPPISGTARARKARVARKRVRATVA